jgi:hypothetical protein
MTTACLICSGLYLIGWIGVMLFLKGASGEMPTPVNYSQSGNPDLTCVAVDWMIVSLDSTKPFYQGSVRWKRLENGDIVTISKKQVFGADHPRQVITDAFMTVSFNEVSSK